MEEPPGAPIDAYIKAMGPLVIQAYIEQKFPAGIVALGYYSAENAAMWIDIDEFMVFAARYLQAIPSSGTLRNGSLSQSQAGSSSILAQSSTASVKVEIPTPDLAAVKKRKQSDIDSPSPSNSDIEFISINVPPRPTKKRKSKKSKGKRRAVSNVPTSQSDTDLESTSIIQITRQLSVTEIRTLSTIPSTWPIFNGAYLLDLRNDPRDWKDSSGSLLSMAAIIKSQDQDSWGQGSAGSIQPRKATKVYVLDGQLCQVSEHNCQGVYHCSELDMGLLDQCKRYDPDEDEMRELFEAERSVNIAELSTLEISAAAFFKEAMKEPCNGTLHDGRDCDGEPIYRLYKKNNFYGKAGFIGCSKWIQGKNSNDHRFIGIPKDVKEELVIELFESEDGSFKSKSIGTKECARILHPRNGGRGRRECPYTHIKAGKVVQGTLVARRCPAKIKIFSPLNRDDRRAIVLLDGPHNHPCFPATKLSREGKDKYEEAIKVNGVARSTVIKCDTATTTKGIFGGKALSAVDPALGIARNKRRIVRKLRTENNPFGNGIEGVLYQKQEDDRHISASKRYIQEILSKDGVNMVITMLPDLVSRVHDADATLHDNTYKRVFGEWKEWEVVIWDKRLNQRITVARIYCNKETRKAFESMWSGFWSTIERVTGRPLSFKFIDGHGIRAILVDGCKPQAEACGDALIKLISDRPRSLVKESDPQIVIQHILRTCDIHLERKLDNLAKTLPPEVMERVRGFPFLKTVDEVNAFKVWCEKSEFKCLRDWIIDKKGSPWFVPSVNRFMSKILEEDWYLTPGDTNLNESAHPFTNMHTGINLSLLEAISQARIMDSNILDTLQLSEANCVLANNRNTKPERDHANRKRAEGRARATTSRREIANEINVIRQDIVQLSQISKDAGDRRKELQQELKINTATQGLTVETAELNSEIEQLSQRKADAIERKRELQAEKHLIQETHGIRQSPLKLNARGKARIPGLDDVLPLLIASEESGASSLSQIDDTTESVHDFPTCFPQPAPLDQTAPQLHTVVPPQPTQHCREVISGGVYPERTVPIPLLHTPNPLLDFDPKAVDVRNTASLQRLKRKDLNELCFLHRVPASGKNSDCIARLQSLPQYRDPVI